MLEVQELQIKEKYIGTILIHQDINISDCFSDSRPVVMMDVRMSLCALLFIAVTVMM